MLDGIQADEIARAALKAFHDLPKSHKPVLRDSGRPEWTVLAAFLLSFPDPNSGRRQLHVASLG